VVGVHGSLSASSEAKVYFDKNMSYLYGDRRYAMSLIYAVYLCGAIFGGGCEGEPFIVPAQGAGGMTAVQYCKWWAATNNAGLHGDPRAKYVCTTIDTGVRIRAVD
jgi:hypothetical protein